MGATICRRRSNYWTLNGSDIYNNNAGNAGIGINTPAAKLHIKGTANTSQLIIDASATQSNIQPLIRLRDASGVDLLHIHSVIYLTLLLD